MAKSEQYSTHHGPATVELSADGQTVNWSFTYGTETVTGSVPVEENAEPAAFHKARKAVDAAAAELVARGPVTPAEPAVVTPPTGEDTVE